MIVHVLNFVIGSYPPFTAACNTLRANIGGAIELYSTRHTPLASGLDGFSPAPRRREHLVMEQRYTEGEEREGERTEQLRLRRRMADYGAAAIAGWETHWGSHWWNLPCDRTSCWILWDLPEKVAPRPTPPPPPPPRPVVFRPPELPDPQEAPEGIAMEEKGATGDSSGERSDSCASGAYISSLHTLSLLHSIIRLYFERTACVIDVTQ